MITSDEPPKCPYCGQFGHNEDEESCQRRKIDAIRFRDIWENRVCFLCQKDADECRCRL